MKYNATIGLEIHVELKTKTKMFCSSKNDPMEKKPNVNICPVCMGHPGTLPVINKEAVRHVLKVGVALGGEIADFTEFDRKNYFYPDIPKGYQISQYKYPLVSGGSLNGVDITRVHLEEDTARSSHENKEYSLVDFNRAGLPLMELVTEPVIHSAKQAGDFARDLQLLLRYLNVADANMENGEMRVEANVSISDTEEFGNKVEIKNLNSFKIVEKAIEYEVERQTKVLEESGEIVQETRGWNENTSKTFSQRRKEYSHDYRYFPEPDLPKLKISEIEEFSLDSLKKEISELPQAKRERYKSNFGIKDEDINIYLQDFNLADFFESVISSFIEDRDKIALASNYITSDIVSILKEKKGDYGFLEPTNLAVVIDMVSSGDLSSRGAKDLIQIIYSEEGNAREIAEEQGLLQNSNEEEISKIVQQIISENPTVVDDFKSGKENALKFLIGQGMKLTKGSANPAVLDEIFRKLI
jgi:aspartyl-tRNA(Asn)/glutamyl-tRNA(Gln) amidotransferase subunit B